MIRDGKSLSGSERNVVFLNIANDEKRFVEVSSASGFDSPGDGRGMGIVDWDGDGDLDVWLSNRTGPAVSFYENQIGQDQNFVAFELQGTAPNCNRDAIGSRVEIEVDGKLLLRGLRAGDGFRSQSSKQVHFGLGKADKIDRLTVGWPNGERENFSGASAGGAFRLIQGSGKAAPIESRKFTIPKGEALESPLPGTFARLTRRSPFPKMPVELGGNERPSLVILWQPECNDCRQELADLAERKKELENLGLDILAVTADGEGRREKAEAFLSETGYPFQSGFLSDEMVERILVFHRHLFYQPYHLQVPTSFLLDGEGRLTGVFRGELDWDEINYQVKTLESKGSVEPIIAGTEYIRFDMSRPAVLIKAYLDEGIADEAERVFRLDRTHQTIESQSVDILRSIGETYLFRKDLENAERLFSEALAINKTDARVLNQSGVVQFAKRNTAGAMSFWEQACEADPSAPEPLMNLGKNLLKAGKTDRAMGFLERYHELEPEDPDGHNYLAIVYLRKVQFSNAQTHLERLIELRPSDGGAYLNLAKVHLQFREIETARQILTKALGVNEIPTEAKEQIKVLLQQIGD